MNSQGGYPHGNRPLLGDIVADLDRAERGESGVNMDKTITIPPDNSMLILNPDGRVSLNVCGRDNRNGRPPLYWRFCCCRWVSFLLFVLSCRMEELLLLCL